MNNVPPVSDNLLKKLSSETQLVGKQAILKGWAEEPECQALIVNVIIMPFSIFYRNQFMTYYETFHKNAVKALKELVANYPNINDYELDTGYVLTVKTEETITPENVIKSRGDFMLLEDLTNQRQEILKKGLSVVKNKRVYK